MQNLKTDCENGVIDFIVHMGDHAYDLAGAGDKRGDAYMNVFQPTLSTCPWIPIIGNHEVNDGDHYQRYLNMTWGETLGDSDDEDDTSIRSTADSALGEFLTKATLFGLGFHSSVPSNTSRYFGVTIGSIHIAGLDLNNLDKGQLAWLDDDLASIDRKVTPWILVSSHFPMYHPLLQSNLNASSTFYLGDGHEKFTTSGHDFIPLMQCQNDGICDESVGMWLNSIQSKLLPLLKKHGVDLYDAGHVHDYASTYPMCHGDVCKDESGKDIKSFNEPKGTIHITEGNGGVPGVNGTNTLKSCNSKKKEWCRLHGTGGNHGRIKVLNSTHLKYQHVENPTGKVTDDFVVQQSNHGPF